MSADWGALVDLCEENLNTASGDLKSALNSILRTQKSAKVMYENVANFAEEYDFEPETPGNGYRTFMKLTTTCVDMIIMVNKKVLNKEQGFFENNVKDLMALAETFEMLNSGLRFLETMRNLQPEKGQLYNDHSPSEIYEIANVPINQFAFFGRALCMQYTPSIRIMLKITLFTMVLVHELSYSKTSVLTRMATILSFFNEKKRPETLLKIIQRSNVNLVSSLWFLNEATFLRFFTSLLAPRLNVNLDIPILPGLMSATTETNETIEIPMPMSHLGKRVINARLMSYRRRIGMVGDLGTETRLAPQARALIFHVHGGGFIAQSSRSHEFYLRQWAFELDIPILSVDYSLSPEAPYPRALEELLYVFAWAQRHGPNMLGTTLEKIIVIGDSAGGNLAVAMTLKTIHLRIRKPDGLLILYAPFRLQCTPTPARLLGICDALLPLEFTVRCVKAYAGMEDHIPEDEDEIWEMIRNPVKQIDFHVATDPFMSPYLAYEEWLRQMPRTKIVALDLDPYLDDCVMFAKKLKSLGVKVGLDVLEGLPHAFLNFVQISEEARAGSKMSVERIKELLK